METTTPSKRTVLACHVQRGDLVTHERRQYRVVKVGQVVLYRVRQDAVGATKLTLAATKSRRTAELKLAHEAPVTVTR